MVDVLVEHLYEHKKSSFKTTLWECFGDVIVDNIKRNLAETYNTEHTLCEVCGERIEATSNRKKYCEPCWIEKEREQTRERVRKYRASKKIVTV